MVTRAAASRVHRPAADLSWMDSGLCTQIGDDSVFFPDQGRATRAAKATCSRCPVIDQCLDYALAHGERYGVWGGKSERERRRMMKGATA